MKVNPGFEPTLVIVVNRRDDADRAVDALE